MAKDLHGLEWRFRHIYRGTTESMPFYFDLSFPKIHHSNRNCEFVWCEKVWIFTFWFEQGNREGICSPRDGVLSWTRRSLSLAMPCSFLGIESLPSRNFAGALLWFSCYIHYRGEDGELRLGIRRAAQVKGCATFPTLYGQQLNFSSLKDVINSISTRSAFNLFYNPRYCAMPFI